MKNHDHFDYTRCGILTETNYTKLVNYQLKRIFFISTIYVLDLKPQNLLI